MDADPNFRLKAFAVISCVLGVFLVTFVAQRVWFWMRTRRRQDVDTSRVEPIVDFGLLGIGAIVIWLAVEALVLAVLTAPLHVQPAVRHKVAEIEVGRLDAETRQLNLLFYPVDRAGRRQTAQRRPVLTSGHEFELIVQVLEWRSIWTWLGQGGFYQFLSLGGIDPVGGNPEKTSLERAELPSTAGAAMFRKEGEVYDIFLNPDSGELEITLQQGE
jgi:hypothetical protein